MCNNAFEEEFWLNIDKPKEQGQLLFDFGDCWNWNGYIDDTGYGQFKRSLRAHRVSWELKNGPIPKGLCILHKCHNRRCVNPDHLYCGTHKDNARDRIEFGRHENAKLTSLNIEVIRHLYDSKEMSQRELAKAFGVAQSYISQIVRYKCRT